MFELGDFCSNAQRKMREKLRSASGRSDQGVSNIEVLDGAGSSHVTITIQIGEIKMHSRAASFVVGAVLVSVLVVAGTAAVIAAPERSAAQEKVAFGVTQVFIRNGEYSPSSIEVLLGTVVTWTNQDNVPHGVVISPVVISSQDIWQSGPLYRGESFTYTFTSRGTFSYRCSEHPDMLGTVLVT